MSTITLHQTVNDFEANVTPDNLFRLSDYRGKSHLILYFYPRDNTPGCTQEGQDFRDHYATFRDYDTEIFGISRDSLKVHLNFKTKQAFPFELISDKNEALCQQFDVIKPKNLYGRQVQGIERSTFLIDKQGILSHEWRKVTVKGHVAEVLKVIKTL